MSLLPRAIAIQGIGFTPIYIAVQGLISQIQQELLSPKAGQAKPKFSYRHTPKTKSVAAMSALQYRSLEQEPLVQTEPRAEQIPALDMNQVKQFSLSDVFLKVAIAHYEAAKKSLEDIKRKAGQQAEKEFLDQIRLQRIVAARKLDDEAALLLLL